MWFLQLLKHLSKLFYPIFDEVLENQKLSCRTIQTSYNASAVSHAYFIIYNSWKRKTQSQNKSDSYCFQLDP